MPVNHAIWTVGSDPVRLPMARLPDERTLEEMICREPTVLSGQWMIIGRQVKTSHGGIIDLLAIAPDSTLVLIEIKCERTPRQVVAQALDYASWLDDIEVMRVGEIYRSYSGGGTLEHDFRERFGSEPDEEAMTGSHQIILVAAELDPSTERIIGYLDARGIAINVAFFQVFEHEGQQLLSRAWLIDPSQTQDNAAAPSKSHGEKARWNGEFYVNFGDSTSRSWADARKHGYVSAGGGSWYSATLSKLSEGDRIWVKVPGSGYVGVGRVLEGARPAKDFMIGEAGETDFRIDELEHAALYAARVDDPELTEHFVRVEWLDTVATNDAISEVGLFGNQNTVCQPVTPKWARTVERLREVFTNARD